MRYYLFMAWRFIEMLLAGAASCLLLYPLLHEAGHYLTARLFGAQTATFTLGAHANVTCLLTETAQGFPLPVQNALIGLAGPVFPFAACLLAFLIFPTKGFLINFLLTICSVNVVLEFLFAAAGIVFPFYNSDISSILALYPQMGAPLAIFFVAGAILCLYLPFSGKRLDCLFHIPRRVVEAELKKWQ